MPRLLGALAATGIIVGAVYLLFMFQKVFFGPIDLKKNGGLPDLSGREKAVFIPLVIMIFVMGIFPNVFLKRMEPSVQDFLGAYHAKLAEGDGEARLVSDTFNVRKRAAIARIARGGAPPVADGAAEPTDQAPTAPTAKRVPAPPPPGAANLPGGAQ
jgi:hypothetical protein